MHLSLVSAVVLGLVSVVLGAPQHGKHTPCSKNTTDIDSHQATPSGQLRGQGQFLGLHPTTTKHTPCSKNSTDIGSHQATPSGQLKGQGQFLGLHPTTTTTTTTATATSPLPPAGKDQEKATPTPTGLGTQLDADSQEQKQPPRKTSCTGRHGPKDVTKQPKSTPPPESTPQQTIEPVFQPLKPTTTPPPAPPASSPELSPTPEPTQHKQDTNFLVQPKDGDKSDDQSSEDSYLKLHNDLRANHRAPALEYNKTIAAYAQDYMKTQNCQKKLTHSDSDHNHQHYGENLAKGYHTAEDSIQAWYDEYKYYDFNQPWKVTGNDTGHFTQIAWKGATQLGCAEKPCEEGSGYGGIYLICNYDTGNVHMGLSPEQEKGTEEEKNEAEYRLYKENVLPHV